MSKTVQKSGAQPAVRQDSHAVYPTHYAVKIHSLRLEGSCRATASVNINGCFAVRGIKVMDSSKGLFVSMPSYRAGNGEYLTCTRSLSRSTGILMKGSISSTPPPFCRKFCWASTPCAKGRRASFSTATPM